MFRPFSRRSTPKPARSARRRVLNKLRRAGLASERLEERTVLDAGWVTAISGAISDLAGDAAGNTYVTGSFSSQPSMFGNIELTSDGLGDIFVAKQDANGQYLWATKAGNPSSSSEWSTGIATDADGNVFIAGYFEGTAQFGTQSMTSAGGHDAFVAKLNGSNGQFLWAQQRGGSAYDRALAVAIDPSGNVLVSGQFDGSASSYSSPVAFVSKFATVGTELWTSTATCSEAVLMASVAVDAEGNVYAGGRFRGTAQFPTGTIVSSANLPSIIGSGSSDALITKLDQAGQWQWARPLAGDTSVTVQSSTVASGGQLYVSGQFEGTLNFDATSLTSAGKMNGFVAQIDSATGSVSWARRVGGSEMERLNDVKVDPQGNVNVVGAFRGTADFGAQIMTTDGGVENAFVTKLDTSGAFLESHRIVTGTGNITVFVAGLNIDAAGNLYVGGWFTGATVQFPQQPVSGSGSTGYVVKLPPSAATKFYVVNDTSRDRTYQYAAGGNLAIDNFGLGAANTAPRGAASTAVGDKLWVVDANRNVYVYSAAGALLGSWTAGTLASNATPQGITVSATGDMWIVDATSDKVFKYTGAANRLSGTQAAASSFSLNKSNKSPTDIVTDGNHLWVVNDSSTDKVFKYTLSGSLVASWTIDAANSSPTGITLDPSNPAHLWIVDAGTDRVYEYANAVNQANGSTATAVANFALAAGNTNPQGIADPPQGATPAPAGLPTASLFAASPGPAGQDRAWAAAVDQLFAQHSTQSAEDWRSDWQGEQASGSRKPANRRRA